MAVWIEDRQFDLISVPAPLGVWWYLLDRNLPGKERDQVVAVWEYDLDQSSDVLDLELFQHLCDCRLQESLPSMMQGCAHPEARQWKYLRWEDRPAKNKQRWRNRYWRKHQRDRSWMENSRLPEVMHYLRRKQEQALRPVPHVD